MSACMLFGIACCLLLVFIVPSARENSCQAFCQYMQDELGVCLCVPMQVNIRRPFSNLEMCSTLVVLMGHVARVHGKASCRTTPAGQQAPNRISRQGADAMHNFVKSGCQVCMLLI